MTNAESKTNRKLPTPVYAAAGISDLAYQKLRQLPERVAELRGRVAGGQFDLRSDVDRLRKAARRNATALAGATQAAQERAVAIYGDLVVRGEHIVRGERAPIKVKATVEAKPEAVVEPAAAESANGVEHKPVVKKATPPAAPRD
jgi:heparin binding hemagglutinin HbhA